MTQANKYLILAEKPSVAREIAKVLGVRENSIRGAIEGTFTHEVDEFKGTWFAPPKCKENKVWEAPLAEEVAARCTGKNGIVDSVTSTKGRQRPPLPFDLTTLQREANIRFGLSAKQTLQIAQELYENQKAITYPRTDSKYLTTEVYKEILNHLRAVYLHFPDITVQASERIKTAKKNFPCVNDKKSFGSSRHYPHEQTCRQRTTQPQPMVDI